MEGTRRRRGGARGAESTDRRRRGRGSLYCAPSSRRMHTAIAAGGSLAIALAENLAIALAENLANSTS
jgi:hypothetical protein